MLPSSEGNDFVFVTNREDRLQSRRSRRGKVRFDGGEGEVVGVPASERIVVIRLDELLSHLQNLVLRIADVAKDGEKCATLRVI